MFILQISTILFFVFLIAVDGRLCGLKLATKLSNLCNDNQLNCDGVKIGSDDAAS